MAHFYHIKYLDSYLQGTADKETVKIIETLMVVEPEFAKYVRKKQSIKKKELKVSLKDLLKKTISKLKSENFFEQVYKNILPNHPDGAV